MNFWKRIFTAEILVMDSVTELPQYQEPEPAGHCSVCTTLPPPGSSFVTCQATNWDWRRAKSTSG